MKNNNSQQEVQELNQDKLDKQQDIQQQDDQQENIQEEENQKNIFKDNDDENKEGEFIIIDEQQNEGKKEEGDSTNRKISLKQKKFSKHYNKLFKNTLDKINFKMKDPIERFQIRGEGVYFYFYFVKFFTFVFFIAGILSIASLVINIKGDGLQSSGLQILLKTTVGNLEKVRFDKEKMDQIRNLSPEQRHNFVKQENAHLHQYQLVHMYSDFFINLLFFISIYIFQYKVNRKSEQIDDVYPSIRNHTIMVKGIKGKNNQKIKLKEYFSKFGQVEQIDFAYAYNGCLYNLIKISKNYQKILKIEKKDIPQQKKVKKFDKKFKKIKKHTKVIVNKTNQQNFNFRFFNNFDIIYVFVTYNHNKTPLKIMNDFEKEYQRSYKQILLCQNKEIDQQYKYENQNLQVTLPDHPQNIIWENMEFSRQYRLKRKAMLVLVSFFLVLISFLANLILTALQEDSHEVSCDNQTITMDTVKAATGDYKMQIIQCYCEQFSFFHFFKNQGTDEFKICEPFYIGQIEFFAINIGIGFLISITNYIIEIIIIKFTKLIKYEQLTKLITQQMIYTFVVEYINTAFILLFIYAEINGFAIIREFNKIIEHNVFKINNFINSMNRKWYENVGSNLITPLLISVFSPHLLDLIIVLCKKYYYRRFKKKQLEKEEFDVGSNLKEILKLIVICYTFSSGIQIYYHFIYAGMAIIYWTQKYMFVYNSNIPPPLSKKFIQKIYPLLKATLIIHMIFSVLFYSNDDIFPMNLNVQLDQNMPHKPQPDITLAHILYRTIPIVIQICLFMFIYIIEMLFEKPVVMFYNLITKKNKLKKIESLELNKDSEELKKNKNDKYDIMVNAKYEEVFDFQDEKLTKVKELIKESSLQELVQFKSANNFQQKSRTFTKLVSIEMEPLKKEIQIIIF